MSIHHYALPASKTQTDLDMPFYKKPNQNMLGGPKIKMKKSEWKTKKEKKNKRQKGESNDIFKERVYIRRSCFKR